MLYLLAALLILIALLAASVRLAVLYSEDYSAELASLVSTYVGSPVEIGDVDLVWNRFDANASLKDVQIRSADGSETVLELPQIELQLNVRDMLLERNLSVRSVQLHNLSLAASYDGRGKLKVMGTGLSGSAAGSRLTGYSGSVNTDLQGTGAPIPDPETVSAEKDNTEELTTRGLSVLGWLFNAERIAILDSDITLIDTPRDREYKIDNVNIRAFNDDDLHQIRVSSALPENIGANSIASFDFTGDADNIDAWKGQFYVNTEGLNIDEVSEVWRQPLQQFNGLADVQVWGSWNGTRVNKVRLIGAGKNVSLQQPSSGGTYTASLDASNVDVDLDWRRKDNGWQLGLNRFSAVLDNKEVQLDGLDLQLSNEADGKYLSVAGPDIDLQSLRPTFGYIDALLPNDAPFRAHSLRHGLLKDWRASGILNSGGNRLTELRVNAVDLSVDPFDKTPGISDLSAAVVFNDGTGKVSIDNQDIALSLPMYFDQPLPVINVHGDISFVVNPDINSDSKSGDVNSSLAWKAVSEDLRLSSLDLNTSATFSLSGMSGGSRLIDARATILNANIARLKDYYPTRVMKPKFLKWLQNSMVGGDVVRGRVELKGDLTDFAPSKGKGHFYAETDMVNATLKFKQDWPAVESMDGNLSFTTQALRGRVYQGTIRDAQFSDARLYIPDLKNPVAELQANAIGPLADMLDFAQTGPLARFIAKAFGNSTGSGTSRLALDVAVPLTKRLKDKLAIDGEVVLDNARIASKTFGIELESATGNLRFNRRGVVVDDMLVRYQGLPLSVNAIQQSKSGKNINRIRVNGPIALASVMQSYGIPMVNQFEGVSDWNIDIDVTRRANSKKARVEFTATSDLSGTEFRLPVPLNKKAAELREVRIYRDFGSQEKDWWFELPGLINTRARVGADRKLESMAIALGSSDNNVLPWRGIALHGDTHRVDALGWVKLAMDFQAQRKVREKSNRGAFPLFAKINARQMTIGDRVFDELVYIAYRDGTHQVHRVENSLISGEMALRQNPDSDEPLVMRLTRLDKQLLVALASAEKGSGLTDLVAGEVTEQLYDPRAIPALDFNVSELIWDNWRFSKVAMRSVPTDRGMQITALTARQNSMRVSGTGFWEQSNSFGVPAHSTTLDLTASFDNFGRAINEISDVRSFAEGSGEAALSLSWPMPAYAPDLRAIEGRLLFNLRDGRILSVQPGAGRILGLFALQSLPRRINLDFRDITDTGLEYSGVSGNLSISNGKAQTNAIAMSGPVAEILIKGSTGFVDKTYDQTIDVLPRVSGALPLLGVLSGGPAAGVTALLADGVLRGIGVNLDEIGRRRFTLTGSWEQPVWTTINTANNNQLER